MSPGEMIERVVPLLIGLAVGAAGRAAHVPLWEACVAAVIVWGAYVVDDAD